MRAGRESKQTALIQPIRGGAIFELDGVIFNSEAEYFLRRVEGLVSESLRESRGTAPKMLIAPDQSPISIALLEHADSKQPFAYKHFSSSMLMR
jgi:hypothetical protein